MNFLRVQLNPSAEQHARLKALQLAFAEVCNTLTPLVQQTGVWNRVALHHTSYRQLREKFPALGSQMVCNAIYSVSRMSRLVYQHPNSPFSAARLGTHALPLLRFSDNAPVYFDRHTLSVKDGQLSMYTLDGRIRFNVALSRTDEERFHHEKLREVVLSRDSKGAFQLSFWLAVADEESEVDVPAQGTAPQRLLPEYVQVEISQ